MLAYLNNNFDKSFELLSALIDEAQKTNQLDLLGAKIYHKLGSVCVEVMAYDKAIKYLSDAIQLDPSNKETYFNRATAYFETGQFDQAIEDYLMSDKGKYISTKRSAPKEFAKALIKSARQGVSEAYEDFYPSLCNSINGIGTTIWAAHPLNPKKLENANHFANACYEVYECAAEYCKNVDWNTVDDYIVEIKTLYERFDQLSAKERGELFGHAIGKYGVDAVACTLTGAAVVKGSGYAVKGASAIRNLRKANRACILEEMAASKTNKKIISSSALKHAAERDNYFKNVRIHWDKQNKHIPGKHNFEVGRGTILIESNELELLIKQHAGKGQKVTGSLGEVGYKERVDFGKIIGEYAQEIKGEPTKYLKTSKGIITYAKDGSAHVYPTNPNATFN